MARLPTFNRGSSFPVSSVDRRTRPPQRRPQKQGDKGFRTGLEGPRQPPMSSDSSSAPQFVEDLSHDLIAWKQCSLTTIQGGNPATKLPKLALGKFAITLSQVLNELVAF